MPSFSWRAPRAAAAFAVAFLLAPAPARAQTAGVAGSSTTRTAARPPRPLSLDAALELGVRQSESVRIADAAVTRARGQVVQARSAYFPQLSGTGSYQRQIQSQFQALANQSAASSPAFTATTPVALCTPTLAANATPDQRAAALAAAQTCPTAGGGGISSLTKAFANPNTIVLGVSGSQTLYSGGRLGASRTSAAAGQRSANIGLTSTRAQVRLDVATAYYDASLADVLVGIAESTLVQAERAYRQTALGREVGNISEFDLLRARVSRDNQRPVLVQARGNRDIAYLRLRQLLNVPLDEPLRLTTPLPLPPGGQAVGAPSSPLAGGATGTAPAGARSDRVARTVVRGDTVVVTRVDFDPAEVLGDDPQVTASVDSAVARADTAGRSRATARQSRENLVVQQSLLRIARAERLPSLALQGNYQRYGYPVGNGISFPTALNQYYPNFTVGLGLSIPVFTGGRIGGDVLVAEANLREAEATSRQVEQLASLDAQLAVTQFAQAEAQLRSTAGTSEQAARAYQIAEVRYREGLSTQIELSDSRVQLQQAQANAAQAARDREVARLRLSLLRDLPLSSTVQAGAQSGAGSTVGNTTRSGVSSGVGSSASGTTTTTGAAGTTTTTTTTGAVPGTTTGQPQTGTGTP